MMQLERIFYINSEAAQGRRHAMEAALSTAAAPFERWPAVMGGPALNTTHAEHMSRGVESYLRGPHTGVILKWGTVGNYLSHVRLPLES